MNEQPTQQPYNQPPQPTSQPVNPAITPAPVTPGYMGQPVSPAPDPALYQSPSVPITSRTPKIPVWLFVFLGVSLASAAGLIVAVFVLM